MISTRQCRRRQIPKSKKKARKSLPASLRSSMSYSTIGNSRRWKTFCASDKILTNIRSPLEDDGASDIAAYNKELEQRGNSKWHDVAWLYAECYLYR